MKKQSFLAVLVCAAFLASCGSGKVNEFTHEIKNVQMTAGPFDTPGANTIQAELKLDLDSLFKANKADRNKIKHITIEEFKFNVAGGGNFDNYQSFTVQFYSDKNGMTKLGVINPVPKSQTSISAAVTEKANLSKYFSEPSILMIIDVNTTAADSVAQNMTADLKVKFSAKETK